MSSVADRPVRLGVIGCGHVLGEYARNLDRIDDCAIAAVCDSRDDRAQAAASRCGATALSVEGLCADPSIDAVLNLTSPHAHAAVTAAALLAGKPVYTEKPLATQPSEALDLLILAAERDLALGCAPDTHLAPPFRLAQQLVGSIGPIRYGHSVGLYGPREEWHPAADRLYAEDAGPLLDMGPYHVNALVRLIGPVKAVQASTRTDSATREVASGPSAGYEFVADAPVTIVGVIEHVSGALSHLALSFEIDGLTSPLQPAPAGITLYGTLGSISLPDPNLYEGQVSLSTFGAGVRTHTVVATSRECRGMGVSQFLRDVRAGRHRAADARVAQHVVEIMNALLMSAQDGQRIALLGEILASDRTDYPSNRTRANDSEAALDSF